MLIIASGLCRIASAHSETTSSRGHRQEGRTEEEIKRDKTRLRGPRPLLSAVSAGARHLKLRWRGSAAFANAAASRSPAEKVKFKAGERRFEISLYLSLIFLASFPSSQSNVDRIGAARGGGAGETLMQPFSPSVCATCLARIL